MNSAASQRAEILERFPRARRDMLIPLLQAVQERQGFLSREAVVEIARHLGVPSSKIYGVATFYNQFRFEAPGRFHVQVCRGTACHVKGSAAVLDALCRELGVKAGQRSRDGLFSLEVVACIGACGLAPVIRVNDEFHANLSADGVREVVELYRKKAAEEDADARA